MRPNRYPYTRSQWEEETTLVCSGDNTSFKLYDGLTKFYLHTIRTGLALWFDLGQCDIF